jgi:hypothetical protein
VKNLYFFHLRRANVLVLKSKMILLEPKHLKNVRLRRANVLILKGKMTLLNRKPPTFFACGALINCIMMLILKGKLALLER